MAVCQPCSYHNLNLLYLDLPCSLCAKSGLAQLVPEHPVQSDVHQSFCPWLRIILSVTQKITTSCRAQSVSTALIKFQNHHLSSQLNLKHKTILMLVSERVLLHQRVQVSSSSSFLASYRKYQLTRMPKIQASGLFPKHTNSSTTQKKSLTRPLTLRYVVPWNCIVKNTQALHQASSPPMTAGHKAL